MKTKLSIFSLVMAFLLVFTACVNSDEKVDSEEKISASSSQEQVSNGESSNDKEDDAYREITDSLSRTVTVPKELESIVCIGVGSLRYTSYMSAQDLVIGVEDYEKEKNIQRLYNYVNYEKFEELPIIGGNGDPNAEAIISLDPDVIVMTEYAGVDADELQAKTNIPVFVIPGTDSALDDRTYETIRYLGELFNMDNRAKELTTYLQSIEEDLQNRTKDMPDEDKPSVFVAGVSYKGHHGFEGTEAYYAPFELVNAKNLANTSGNEGPFNIDLEQVLEWDPDYIFIDYNGLPLIKEDYQTNKEFYDSLSAFQKGNVYSQIPFRSSAANLETAIADAYYIGTVIYPEAFANLDFDKTVSEIFMNILGKDPSEEMKEAGYQFREIKLEHE